LLGQSGWKIIIRLLRKQMYEISCMLVIDVATPLQAEMG